jgi:lysophospholipase L1-like esterase
LIFLALALTACPRTAEVTASPAAARSALPEEAAGLADLFENLYELEQNARQTPVYILHIGDSHTASGWFAGRLRERFQERFGSAGRGQLPPGVPFQWYHPAQVLVEQSKGWQVQNSFSRSAKGLFGLAGFRTVSDDPEAVMRLECQTEPFDFAEIEVAAGPGFGGLKVRIDEREEQVYQTAADSLKARRIRIETDPPARCLELSPAGDGPVEILSWTVQRVGPGIVYDSHGIVGATIDIVGRWTPQVVAWQLAHRPPSLIVIEYGGNEGFHDDLDPLEYRAHFRKRVDYLRRSAPGASLLILGPSDGARLPSYCLKPEKKEKTENDKNETAPKPEKKDFDCRPLTAEELAGYDRMIAEEDRELCRWHAPPNLGVVREIQRDVAQKEGWPFWDWSGLMEGECGIHDWAKAEPSLAARDRVHLQVGGYKLSADALFDLVMDYYETYRLARR